MRASNVGTLALASLLYLGAGVIHAAFDQEVFQNCDAKCERDFLRCRDGCCVLRVTGVLAVCRTNCIEVCNLADSFCNAGCQATADAADVDPVARLSKSARAVFVTGPLPCEEGLKILSLDVTASQRTNGVVGKGRTKGVCTGAEGRFGVKVVTRGKKRLRAPGQVQVCVLVRLGLPGLVTDTRQWCRNDVTLLPEGVELEP